MSNLLPAQKLYQKTIKDFAFILKDKKLNSSYDVDNSLSNFVVLTLVNQIRHDKTIWLLENNKELFLNLFIELENDENIKLTLESFKSNPTIEVNEINSKKNIFDSFINKLISTLQNLSIDIKLNPTQTKDFFETGLIYILYSLVEVKIEADIDDILADPEYDKKLKIILNNTRLFSNFRQLVINYFGSKINDFIVNVNGLTPLMAKEWNPKTNKDQ